MRSAGVQPVDGIPSIDDAGQRQEYVIRGIGVLSHRQATQHVGHAGAGVAAAAERFR
jgi:hypothetical protein